MPPSPILLLLLAAYAHGGVNADPTPTEPPDPRSKSLILVKVWSSIIFFVATFLARVLPHLLKRYERLIQVGAQFAGGVFLGTALLQFLSDSDQAFEHLKAKDKFYYYPFAFLLASVGYLLTLLIDCVVLWVHRKQRSSDGVTVRLPGAVQQRKSISSIGTSQSQIRVDDATDQFTNALFVKAISFIDSVLLIILFCVQSVLQGISIGVTTTHNRVWRALWTVTLHKVFVAIAMGLSFLRTIPKPPLLSCIAYAFALAISCPVGVAIGIVIDPTSPGIALDWIYAVFMGLASGVLVYVSVNHILSECYLPQGRVLVDAPHHKFLAVLLGIASVAVVMIWDTSNRAYGDCNIVGVAIGIVINATSPGIALDWIYAVFMGLASGVLVYVSVNHILSEGYFPPGMVSVDAPHHKFLAVLLGIAVAAVVMIWDTSNRAYGVG